MITDLFILVLIIFVAISPVVWDAIKMYYECNN